MLMLLSVTAVDSSTQICAFALVLVATVTPEVVPFSTRLLL